MVVCGLVLVIDTFSGILLDGWWWWLLVVDAIKMGRGNGLFVWHIDDGKTNKHGCTER